MNENINVVNRGVPWLTIVQIALIVLKVSGTLAIPWAIALLPLWIGLAGVALMFLIFLVIVLISIAKKGK